jgi:aromatic ring-opening dioxygenase catalytic subunit (LigB family)
MEASPQILFLSHGGGPLPLLGDRRHDEMVACLRRMAGRLTRPSAILVISAHWEEAVPTITAAPRPSLIHDYDGFPAEAYRISYPCPGDPVLAESIRELLAESLPAVRLDPIRGFDHGLFVPLKILFPEADIPCLQLSLTRDLDPAAHLRLGRALRGLADPNLLVIGSGFSFHNVQAFFSAATAEQERLNWAFEAWLQETCASPLLSTQAREQRLIAWEQVPGARYCHPREEHLLPLHVCCGLAGAACDEAYELTILDRKTSMFLWKGAADSSVPSRQK